MPIGASEGMGVGGGGGGDAATRDAAAAPPEDDPTLCAADETDAEDMVGDAWSLRRKAWEKAISPKSWGRAEPSAEVRLGTSLAEGGSTMLGNLLQ